MVVQGSIRVSLGFLQGYYMVRLWTYGISLGLGPNHHGIVDPSHKLVLLFLGIGP